MLLNKLMVDLTGSLKSGDTTRTATLRYLIAAVKKYEIDTYPPGSDKKLQDEEVLHIIARQVKTHRESIEAFRKGNRQDLVDKETAELTILESYLPKQLTDAEIAQLVEKNIQSGITQFGSLMGKTMAEVGGKASGDRVAQIVKEKLISK